MTIPEASRLVLQSGVLSKGGEVFTLDMGKPIKIVDLAKDMIRLSGSASDIPITFTGLRPGEKMYEELSYNEATIKKTIHPKIFVDEEPHIYTLDTITALITPLKTTPSHLQKDLQTALATITPTPT